MVSVVVPTYNNGSQLISTIKNILNQNIQNLEVVVVDDGSSDDTCHQINQLNNNCIKYYKNNQNIGTTRSRIVGIKKATYQYISFLDDDDLWFPKKLNKQLVEIKKSNCDFVMCNYLVNNMIDNNQYEKNLNSYSENFLFNIIRRPGPFLQCCLFQKQFLLNHVACFDPSSEPSEDWDFFISISKSNPKIKNINESLFQWNLSLKSQSSLYNHEALAVEYIINKHYQYILKNSSFENVSLLYRKLASMFFIIKQFNASDQYFKKSIFLNPLSLKNLFLRVLFSFPKNIRIKTMSLFIKKII